MNDSNVLYQPFDIETHAKEFINYLEVIIKPDGTIEYAIPSHQRKLEEIARSNYEDFDEKVNYLDYCSDYLQWLCDITNCVSVWNEGCVKPAMITNEQIESLKKLKEAHYVLAPYITLYQGEI